MLTKKEVGRIEAAATEPPWRGVFDADALALIADWKAMREIVEELAEWDCYHYDKWAGGKTCAEEKREPCWPCKARAMLSKRDKENGAMTDARAVLGPLVKRHFGDVEWKLGESDEMDTLTVYVDMDIVRFRDVRHALCEELRLVAPELHGRLGIARGRTKKEDKPCPNP